MIVENITLNFKEAVIYRKPGGRAVLVKKKNNGKIKIQQKKIRN